MNKNHRFVRSGLLLLAASLPVHADYFWDGTDLTADADGGAGVWDNTTANWSTAATGGSAAVWQSSESAVFGGASGTVSVAAGGVAAAGLAFDVDGYILENNSVALGAGGVFTATGAGATIRSVLTGTQGLFKTGEGTLTLAGGNTYTGATQISNGALKLSQAVTPYRYYRFTVSMNFGNGTTSQDGYNQFGELHYYSGGVWTPATAGFQSGGGTGEQRWQNANDNAGANVAGFSKYGFNARPYFVTFDYGSPVLFDSYNWSTANDSTPARNPRKWVVAGSNDNVTFTTIDDRSLGIQTGPTATYTWSSPNGAFETNTNATNGGAAGAYPLAGSSLPAGSAVQIAAGATLDLNGINQVSASLGDLSGDGGTVTNSSTTKPVTFAVGTSNASTTFSGVITNAAGGALTFAKVGTGILTLSGDDSNTYTGTTILGGTGKLLLAKTGGAIAIPGNVELSSTAFNGNNSGIVLAENEQIADSAILTWTGNSYGSTTAQNQADTYFRLNGKTETVGGLVSPSGSGAAAIENRGFNDTATYPTGNLIINVAGTSTYSYFGQIRNVDGGTNGGTIAITKTGTGTQVLAGTMTGVTGPTQVLGGTLRLNNTLAAASVAVSGSGSILEGTGTTAGPITVSAGGILQPGVAGAGNFNAPGGVTIGNGGTLALSGTASLGGSPVIGSSGTLTGTGTINGNVTAQAGSEISPGGTGIATLTTNGTLSLAGTATFELNKTGTTLTTDKLKGFSSASLGGTLSIVFSGDAPVLGDSFQLLEPGVGGTLSGGFTTITGLPALAPGLQWETTTLSTNGTLTVVDTASTPAFNLAGGSYQGAQSITITSDTGSTIYYTLDGSDPVPAAPGTFSTASPATGITVPTDSAVTIKAYAATPGFGDSDIVTAVYRTATTPRWVVDADGNWSTATNWFNEVIPNGSGVSADFTLPQSAARTVTLDSSRTLGSLTFGNASAFPWTLSTGNGSVLTLAVPSGSPEIEVQDVDTTISTAIAGTQGFTKSGPGTLVLSGSSSYTGNTLVNGGVLAAATLAAEGSASAIGAGGTLTLDGGTLRFTNANSNNVFNRPIVLGANGGTIDTFTPTNFLFLQGNISGSGTLAKTGARQLILNGNNSYEGDTFIDQAEVQFRTLTSFGTTAGKTIVANGGRACAGGAVTGTILENFDLNGEGGNALGALQANDTGTTINYGGTITLVTNSSIGGGVNFVISGAITGDGALKKSTSNTVTLTGATSNTHLGVTELSGNGRLILAKTDGALAVPGNLLIASTANNGSPNNSGVVLGGNEQIADTAVVSWANAINTYFRINGFTETIRGLASAPGLPNSAAIENRGFGDTVAYPDGLIILATQTDDVFFYEGNIRDRDQGSGGGYLAITKNGPGSQELKGNLAYTGPTTVNGGTLVISSNSATPITVNTGATLKGGGGTSSTLTATTGSTIAPGASVGTFTAGNSVLDGTYACEIDGASADRLTVNGDLDIAGAVLNFTELSAPIAESYVIASYTGTVVGAFEVVNLPEGYELVHDETAKEFRLQQLPGGFADFASENGLSGVATDDFDKDGIQDAVEYVLGTDPTAPTGGAPTFELDGGNMVFTFNRADASLTPDITLAVEVGTGLDTWPDSYAVGLDTAGSDEGITVVDNGASDLITLTVPVGVDEKKFARLVVTVTP
jgi:autotransporter-associated beta strand protein